MLINVFIVLGEAATVLASIPRLRKQTSPSPAFTDLVEIPTLL